MLNYFRVKFFLLYKHFITKSVALRLQVTDDRRVTQRDRNSQVNVTLKIATQKRWKRERTGKGEVQTRGDETRREI